MRRNHFFYVLVGLTVLAMAPAAIADVILTGTIGPITIHDNVIIPPNASATLNGTTIKGNVSVRRDARLVANGARIDGNVQGYGSLVVDLRQQTFVEGNVQGERTRSVRVCGGTTVGANVQIKQAAAPVDVDALLVNLARVGGDVKAEECSGRLRVLASGIIGNLQFQENYRGPYMIRNNRIYGDLQVFKNQGCGWTIGNNVEGNLQSKENWPRPTIRDNIVKGDVDIK